VREKLIDIIYILLYPRDEVNEKSFREDDHIDCSDIQISWNASDQDLLLILIPNTPNQLLWNTHLSGSVGIRYVLVQAAATASRMQAECLAKEFPCAGLVRLSWRSDAVKRRRSKTLSGSGVVAAITAFIAARWVTTRAARRSGSETHCRIISQSHSQSIALLVSIHLQTISVVFLRRHILSNKLCHRHISLLAVICCVHEEGNYTIIRSATAEIARDAGVGAHSVSL